MSEIVYAVHTRACTYLLDDEGICRWVLSRSGARSDDRCVGAQFVAALDLHSKGGLVGELRLGASALFIRSEDGRFVLIRTKPIEHVEIRSPDGSSHDYGAPEPEPVVLPDRLAVAAVFNAPAPAPLPEPPAARVILRDPRTEPPPPMRPSEPPPQRPENTQRMITEPFPAPPGVVQPPPMVHPSTARPPPMVSAPAPLPPPIEQPRTRSFPKPPPRVTSRPQPADDPTSTQPLPGPGPTAPTGPVPAWPPMLAPPPPQAEMLPLGPARPHLPSAEELDADDLEEVGDDDQIYSMEVTLTMPLWPGAANLPLPRR